MNAANASYEWNLTDVCKSKWVKRIGCHADPKRSAGVTSEVNLRNSSYVGSEACERGIHPFFETRGRRYQNYDSSDPTKRSLVLHSFFKFSHDLSKLVAIDTIIKRKKRYSRLKTPWWLVFQRVRTGIRCQEEGDSNLSSKANFKMSIRCHDHKLGHSILCHDSCENCSP